MAKFLLLYRGPAPADDFSPEQQEQQMAAWGAWMGRVGDALVDLGAPASPGAVVVDDGSEGVAGDVTGYTIVSADDLVGAQALLAGHPMLSDSDGMYSVEILELHPIEM